MIRKNSERAYVYTYICMHMCVCAHAVGTLACFPGVFSPPYLTSTVLKSAFWHRCWEALPACPASPRSKGAVAVGHGIGFCFSVRCCIVSGFFALFLNLYCPCLAEALTQKRPSKYFLSESRVYQINQGIPIYTILLF